MTESLATAHVRPAGISRGDGSRETATVAVDLFRIIPLGRGMFALVDAEDYDRVSRHSWSPGKGKSNRNYYAKADALYMHRVVLGIKDRRVRVDHRNGDTLDNRKQNLRTATSVQNVANRAVQDSESGFKGVYPSRSRWRARIGDGGGTNLGTYDTPEQAALAYDTAARKLWGEYACVNFPLPGERGCRVHDKSEKAAGTTEPRPSWGMAARNKHRESRETSNVRNF